MVSNPKTTQPGIFFSWFYIRAASSSFIISDKFICWFDFIRFYPLISVCDSKPSMDGRFTPKNASGSLWVPGSAQIKGNHLLVNYLKDHSIKMIHFCSFAELLTARAVSPGNRLKKTHFTPGNLSWMHRILSVLSQISLHTAQELFFVQENFRTGLWNAILCSKGNLHKYRERTDLVVLKDNGIINMKSMEFSEQILTTWNHFSGLQAPLSWMHPHWKMWVQHNSQEFFRQIPVDFWSFCTSPRFPF